MNAAHIESRLPLMSEIALVKVDMLVFAAAIYFLEAGDLNIQYLVLVLMCILAYI